MQGIPFPNEVFSLPDLLMFAPFLVLGWAYAPKGITPVSGFEIEKYLGVWYEIARFDHRFERNLVNVSAAYKLRNEGGVEVVNRGYDVTHNKWKEARGRAYFVSEPDIAQLKVTFFRPFYGGYNIIELDRERYSSALVCGPDKSYLWILARNRELDPATMERLLARAQESGFEIEKLINVRQDYPVT